MMIFWLGLALLFIALGLFICTQNTQNVIGIPMVIIGVVILLILSIPAHGHDHSRPELSEWFVTLRSGKGACCDGKDQLHLTEIDWVTQNKPNSQYRVKVPATKAGFEAAMSGAPVTETVWIDVPDDAIVDEPNKAGHAMVWPLYGYGGLTIRCFMPGSMT